MPRRGDRSDGRVHASVLGAGLIAAVLVVGVLAVLNGCSEPPEPTWDSFTVTAKPLGDVSAYGSVVPVEFTVTNGHDVPVFVERIEATAGRRWELMAFSRREVMQIEKAASGRLKWTEAGAAPGAKQYRALVHHGLLLPGQQATFVLPYRVIAGRDKLIITFTPTTPGELEEGIYLPDGDREWRPADEESLAAFGAAGPAPLAAAAPATERAVLRLKPVPQPEPTLAGIEMALPAPLAPFDPKWARNLRDGPEAWAFSPKLGGYIVRVRSGSYNLQLEEEVIPLPPVPFEFFEAIDGPAGETKLLRHTGDIDVVTATNVREKLKEVLRSKRQISFADDRTKAAFEERPW